MARAIIEEFSDMRPHHIGDAIDAQNVQENEDQDLEGMETEPDHAVRDYEGNFREGGGPEEAIMFKRCDVKQVVATAVLFVF